MTEGWTSAVTDGEKILKRETALLCRFCFYCTRSFGNTVYPGFNGSIASMRARRGHRSAGACTKAKVKGCSRGPRAGAARGTTASRQAAPPGRIPARSPGPGQARPGAAGLLRPPGGWNFPPDGCFSCACFASLCERTALGLRPAAPAATCPRPPPARRPSFYSLYFFRFTRCCCLPPQPLPAAGRHPLAALPAPGASGGEGEGGKHQSTAAVKAAAHLEQQEGSPGDEGDPCEVGTGL